MYFSIMDIGGNVLRWYDDEAAAREALDRMVEADPGAAEDLVIIQFDENDEPVGDAILPPRTKVTISESPWLKPGERREYDEPATARAGALKDTEQRTLVGA